MADGEGVIVEEEAAVGLAHYLTEIGRLGNRTARDVGAAIQSGVNAQWGSAKVKQFQDAQGAGWVVDLTERFRGEVLFGIVRSNKGRHHVVSVVGEDKLREMFPQSKLKPKPKDQDHLNEMPTHEQQGLDPKNPSGPTLAEQRDHLAKVSQNLKAENEAMKAKLATEQEGPALVRWKVAVKEENGQSFESEEAEITVAGVGEKIQALINIGVKPEHIKVWSRCQQPKIRVELE